MKLNQDGQPHFQKWEGLEIIYFIDNDD
jgi:hypothetical protein